MTWEYKIVFVTASRPSRSGLPEDINEQFDKYGSEGWELVKVESKLTGGFMLFGIGRFSSTSGYVAFFKRPKN